jgi:hypothetical protein
VAKPLFHASDDGSREMANDDRAERLKAALRENLKRRKAQARGRDAAKDERVEGEASADPKPRSD